MTSGQLARELEVTRRTILRDIDALTEAGVPVIAFQGNQGGIELGFDYRTRLTGLADDEIEAFALMLSHPMPELHVLGLEAAAARARAKLVESLPAPDRSRIAATTGRFRYSPARRPPDDPRVEAMAGAIRNRRSVQIQAGCNGARTVHPVGMIMGEAGFEIIDARDPDAPIAISAWGSINIQAQRF